MPQFTPPRIRKAARSDARASSVEKRREKDAERKRLQRANETPAEKEARNEKKRTTAQRKRDSESSDASKERLVKQKSIDTNRRNNESAEQHQSRLEQQRTANTVRRNNETDEQHQSRLEQQRTTDTTRRSDETAEERATRVRSISRRRQQRAMETKNNPSVKTWPAAIPQKVKEQCLSEFNKKMSMDSLREQVCATCNARHNEKTVHNMLLSDINDNLLIPHRDLHGTIPETRTTAFQNIASDREAVAFNEQGKSRISQMLLKSSFFQGTELI